MTFITNIEINEEPTEVIVHFTKTFGELEITGMQDMAGNEIAPDLLSETDNDTLMEDLADKWVEELDYKRAS